ncbi:hypothetical protein GW943_02975 [Candidatus Parcubacteria bacterium]|nr:hypothetical protein [Candidatus Parcubacteria bacterium]
MLKRERRGIPHAFVVITIIVGSVWHLWQVQYAHVTPQRTGGELAALSGDLIFHTGTPIEQANGAELLGIVVYSSDTPELSTVLSSDENLFISGAALSPDRSRAAVASNIFGGETATVQVVTLSTGERTVIDEGVSVLFGTPIWSADGSTFVYTRATLDPNADGDDALTAITEEHMVKVSAVSGSRVDRGEGTPVALSPDGKAILSRTINGTLVFQDQEGVITDLEGTDTTEILMCAQSLDGSRLILIQGGKAALYTIDWGTLTLGEGVSMGDGYTSATFDQSDAMALLRTDGSVDVFHIENETPVFASTYRLTMDVTAQTTTLLDWINPQ